MTIAVSLYSIRPMTVPDLPQIEEIEAESFPSVWPASAYKRELSSNNLARYLVAARAAATAGEEAGIGRLLKSVRGLVRRPEPPALEVIGGFIGVWLMVDEAHIVTVAVRARERRRGIGELLLLAAFDHAADKDVPVLTLECRVSNLEAQALYLKYGFENVGLRKRYYTDNNEDAVIMTTPPVTDPAYRARIEALRRTHQQRWGRARAVSGVVTSPPT